MGPTGTMLMELVGEWGSSRSAAALASSQQPSVCPTSRGMAEWRTDGSGRWFGKVVYGQVVLVEAWVPAEHLKSTGG